MPTGKYPRLWESTAFRLEERIRSGEWTAQLPTQEQLAKQFGVSIRTIRRAEAALQERGLITTQQGRTPTVRYGRRSR